ncbi:MAG: hypothetical protein GY856_45140 [bacterium]|nr:hypothetical protein [bacterium]
MLKTLASLAAILTAAFFLTPGLWARPDTPATADSSTLELRLGSAQPGAVMSGGGLELRGVAGRHWNRRPVDHAAVQGRADRRPGRDLDRRLLARESPDDRIPGEFDRLYSRR